MIPTEALRQALDQAIDAVKTLDRDNDYIGNQQIFLLCQYLRAVADPAEYNSTALEPYLTAFYEASKPILVDEFGDPMDYDTARAQFVYVWDGNKVKWARGARLQKAIQAAKSRETNRPELKRYTNSAILLLGHTCYILAKINNNNGIFFLTQTAAGQIMGKSQPIARQTLSLFCQDGILARRLKGHTGRAGEYTYLALNHKS